MISGGGVGSPTTSDATSTVEAVSWRDFTALCRLATSTDFGMNLASDIAAITAQKSKGFMMSARDPAAKSAKALLVFRYLQQSCLWSFSKDSL
jgi:hypothetical protein